MATMLAKVSSSFTVNGVGLLGRELYSNLCCELGADGVFSPLRGKLRVKVAFFILRRSHHYFQHVSFLDEAFYLYDPSSRTLVLQDAFD
jgi:hypothetical protein